MNSPEQSQPSEIGLTEAATRMAALEGPAESKARVKMDAPVAVDETETHADDVDETSFSDEELLAAEADSLSDEDATDAVSEDDGEADEPIDPDQLITVKIDGKTTQVTVKEAAEGYQRQADYSRKMSQLRTEAQTVHQVATQVEGERAEYAQKLAILETELRQLVPQEPDWARLHAEDPINFPLVEKQWRDYQTHIQQMNAERQRLAYMSSQQEQARLQQTVAQGRQVLAEKMPEWKDEAKWTQARSKIRDYGRQAGYSDEELSQVYEPRHVLVLEKARRYDTLMANRPKPQPAAEGPKPLRAGSIASSPKQSTEFSRMKSRLKSSGSVDDAARLFGLLDNRRR